MNITLLEPRKALNKAFLKIKPSRSHIEDFKVNLIKILDSINKKESEEFHKNLVIDFLKKTYYDPNYFVNTKGRNDLVIHNGKDAKSNVGVIIEAKSPINKTEMITVTKLNGKALQELVLYYMRERITHKNTELKHLVVTNIHEWFVFDAQLFNKLFAENKRFTKQFIDFQEGRLSGKTTDYFYREIAKPFIEGLQNEILFAHFDIRKYDKPLRNKDKEDDKKLVALFKLLSPEHLLKLSFANDSNTLDKNFYSELLHIIGLTEVKAGGKKLIQRHKQGDRNPGSLLENAIVQLDSLDKISRLKNPKQYGDTNDERLFTVALELTITWVNRILFLKLLEAQLITYHKGDKTYSFMNGNLIADYDSLNSLFFQVLARKPYDRIDRVKTIFSKVPYLNSSLFEPTDLEHETLFISQLEVHIPLKLLHSTVIKDTSGKKETGDKDSLHYFFAFLEAYDFTSEGSEDIQEDNKTLINASVLGLIFEKINGYKDGSFFTPSFITMYMCKETIRTAVVQKFNEVKNWECANFSELYNKIDDTKEANDIINSLKICDPAVGSGHFLVSALNEIIAIKNDLRVLQDIKGNRLKEYQFEVVNDELIVTDEDGIPFQYNPKNKESQRIQETLFNEKQTIIENCLFGVDINPNSVKICRLRLWIELLKNAYYKNNTNELETLPNIDINIKCGNSLISRFGLNADLKEALKKSNLSIEIYKNAVSSYQNAGSKEQKREMENLITEIKNNFSSTYYRNMKENKLLADYRGQLTNLQTANIDLFGAKMTKSKVEIQKRRLKLLVKSQEEKVSEVINNKIFDNAFEWRFEFPNILNDEGDFVGFDVVIGNPPYIRQESFKEIKEYLKKRYVVFNSMSDLLTYFVELSHNILRQNGTFQFIISGKFTRASYGRQLRKFLSKKTTLTHYIDFGGKSVFDEATVDAAIIGFIKNKNINNTATMILKEVEKSDDFGLNFHNYLHKNAIPFPIVSLSESTWSFDKVKLLPIISKIQKNGIALSAWNISINFGIKTGINEAFIITEELKDKIITEYPNSITIIEPLLRGRDIQKYSPDKIVNWLICTFPSKKINIDDYEGIKQHLSSFGKRIHQTGEKGSRKKTAHNWYETQDNIAFWKDFEKPKLIWKRIGSILRFCYDESGTYCLDSTCIATGDKVKFLTAVLNSKLCNLELFRLSPKTGTGDLIISVQALNQLRVPFPTEKQEATVVNILDQILSIKNNNPLANISLLEQEINTVVYELYGLNEEEIKIVQNS
jgi:adenine-specific DNA-methyltransferase